MPEFTVKEVRLPELHLPEIKRDEIVRSLSGLRIPDVDLARARRATIRIPAVNLSSSDVGKLVTAGAAVLRLVRPAPSRARWLTGQFGRRARSPITRIVQPRRRRSRWPLAVGGMVVLLLGAWAVLRRPAVRQRVDEAGRAARMRFDELRNGITAMEVHEPVAVASTEIAASETESPVTPTDDAGPEIDATTPDALGAPSIESSGTPAFEETGSHH
jgi:hypothetical protein